jgi:hypothetical protein
VGEADGEGVTAGVGSKVKPLQNEGRSVESLQIVSTIHSCWAKIFAYTPGSKKNRIKLANKNICFQ